MLPNSPGSRRFLTELLDYADAHDGAFPQTKSLARYSVQEAQEVRASLKRDQYGQRSGSTLVRIDRILAEHPSPAAYRDMVAKLLGRTPRDLRSEENAQRRQLEVAVNNATIPSLEREALQGLLPGLTGWIGRSLRNDGLMATQERIMAYAQFFNGLPRPDQEPLRTYLANCLGDSHAFDEDRILANAILRRIQDRNPAYDDLDDALLAEGLQRRVAMGSVLVHGPLHFSGPSSFVTSATSSVGLTEDFLRTHTVCDPLPKAVLTIENPSAWEAIRWRLSGVVCILTDGFPTRAAQTLIRTLLANGVQTFHWGDIDDGGFRILQLLQECGPIKPFLMDADTVRHYQGQLRPFNRIKGPLRGQDKALQTCNSLGGWLEQERIPLTDVMQAWTRDV